MMRVFIDSGAFSAYSQKKDIDIDAYCEWLKANRDRYHYYCALDVINDGERSYKNWLYMRKKGLDPIPVYHSAVDPKWLKLYLDAGCEYIGLGAVAFMGMDNRIANLDLVWSKYLVDRDGMPRVKVHGFGVTSFTVMRRYPWFSVDSSSWTFASRNGFLFVARRVNGEFRLDIDGYHRYVSSRSNRNAGSKHMDNCFKSEQDELHAWLDFIEEPYGRSEFRPFVEGAELAQNESVWRCKKRRQPVQVERVVEVGVCNDQQARNRANIKYFVLTARAMPKWPWPFHAHVKHSRTFV